MVSADVVAEYGVQRLHLCHGWLESRRFLRPEPAAGFAGPPARHPSLEGRRTTTVFAFRGKRGAGAGPPSHQEREPKIGHYDHYDHFSGRGRGRSGGVGGRSGQLRGRSGRVSARLRPRRSRGAGGPEARDRMPRANPPGGSAPAAVRVLATQTSASASGPTSKADLSGGFRRKCLSTLFPAESNADVSVEIRRKRRCSFTGPARTQTKAAPLPRHKVRFAAYSAVWAFGQSRKAERTGLGACDRKVEPARVAERRSAPHSSVPHCEIEGTRMRGAPPARYPSLGGRRDTPAFALRGKRGADAGSPTQVAPGECPGPTPRAGAHPPPDPE